MKIENFDVLAYLQATHVAYWESGKNVGKGWVGLSCVYCHDDHNHLGINLDHKHFSCWKCNAKGSVLRLIQDMERIGLHEAISRVEEFETALPTEIADRTRLSEKGIGILPVGCSRVLTVGQEHYLTKRRFNAGNLVREWGLMSGPQTGPWAYRVIIPVHFRGELVTWIGMDTVSKSQVKYKAAPVEESYIPTSELIYGVDHVRDVAVVVEGTTDVWRLGKGAIALLGMNLTHHKINQLLQLKAKKFYVMLDGEELAIKNAHILAKTLSLAGKQVEVLELDEGDPDNLTGEQAQQLRTELGL